MLCTSSFSVGLDLADIECVVHSGVPNTVTDYVQEIGRASHEPSKHGYTVLLTHNGMGVGRPIERAMRDFYKTSNCRRKTLMADFRIQPGRTEICCDSCVWDLSTSCPLCAYIQTDTNQGPHDKVRDRGEQLRCTHNQSCRMKIPFHLLDIHVMARTYLNSTGKKIPCVKNNLPSIDWARDYLKRHKNTLCSRTCQDIKRSRASVSADEVGKYFRNLKTTTEKAGLPPTTYLSYSGKTYYEYHRNTTGKKAET